MSPSTSSSVPSWTWTTYPTSPISLGATWIRAPWLVPPCCERRLHAHPHARPALSARQIVERLRRIVIQNALAALAEEKRFGALHILEVLRAQHHVACRAAALHNLGHGDSPAALAHALILLVGRRGDLFGDTC